MSEVGEGLAQDERDAIAAEAPDESDLPESADPDQTVREAAEADGSEELIKKSERARANFTKRLREIWGDNAPTHDCPACNGLGVTWGETEQAPELVHPDNLVTCDGCNGHGAVITGSKVPENATTVCIRCNGTGFRTVTPQPENVTPIVPSVDTVRVATGQDVMGWQKPDGTFVPLGAPQAGNG